ncbi:MAG: hypothetical protein HQ546_09990 [Planctomycetes bacterium]|nr:hypothetical protein [Planctomycetota bacterium]
MGNRMRNWTRRVAWALILISALCLLMAWVAGEWIIPSYIREQVSEALAGVWGGSVTIREIRFSYFGPIDLIEVRVEDADGQQWLAAETLRVRLRHWPGLNPAVEDLEIDQLHVHVYESPTVHRPTDFAEPVSPDAIPHRIRVHSLVISGSRGHEGVNLEAMRVAVDYRDGRYALLVETLPPYQNRLVLRGWLEPGSGRFQAETRVDRAITPPQFRFVRQVLVPSLPVEYAQGHIAGRLDVHGTVQKPQSYQIAADGRISDGSLTLPKGIMVEGLATDLNLQNGRLRLTGVSCRSLGGRAEGEGVLDWGEGIIAYEGNAAVENLDPAVFADALELFCGVRKGKINGEFAVKGGSRQPLRVRGRGDVRADVQSGPVQMVHGPFSFDVRWVPDQAGVLEPQGQVTLQGWEASTNGCLTTNLEASLQLKGRKITIKSVSASTMDGTMAASGHVVFPEHWPGNPIEFALAMVLKDVQTDVLCKAIGLSAGLPAGQVNLKTDLSGAAGRTGRLRASGGVSAMIGGSRQRLTGTYDLDFSGLGRGKEMRIGGSLTNWAWSEEDHSLASLRHATIATRDGDLVVENAVIGTRGGDVHVQGRLSRDQQGVLTHQWQFSCRDLDLASLMPWGDGDGPRPLTRVSLEGTLAGREAGLLTAKAQGQTFVQWPGQPFQATADVSVDLSLKNLRMPLESLTMKVGVKDGLARNDKGEIVTDVTGSLQIAPGIPASVRLAGRAAGGQFSADLRLMMPERLLKYVGEVQVRDMDLAHLPGFPNPTGVRSTSVSGLFTVESDQIETLRICGKGTAAASLNLHAGWDLAGDYEFDGHLSGLGKANPLQIKGNGRLFGWNVHNSHGTAVKDFRCSVLAFGRSVDVGGIRGSFLGGSGQGLLRLDLPTDKPMSLRGRLLLADLELSTVAQVMGHEEADVAGKMDFAYRFSGQELTLEGINGSGVLHVRQSRMGGVPLVEALVAAVRARPEAAADTDLDLEFDNAGQNLTIVGGRLATPLAAVRPIPGGSVNLATRELDVHVVAAILDDIDELVNVPFLKLLVPFTRRLSQLHVTGTWESRQTIQVSKEPLRDIGSATVEFFKGVVKTGGDLGDVVVQPIHELLL